MRNLAHGILPIDEVSARAIIGWKYKPPYDIYNIVTESIKETVEYFLDPQYAYHISKEENGEVVFFCSFGRDAQVPGGDYSVPALDIGVGVRPDLTGRGKGSEFIQIVLDFAGHKFQPTMIRVTIAGFNTRAIRVWQKAGFQQVQSFQRIPDGKPFLILISEA